NTSELPARVSAAIPNQSLFQGLSAGRAGMLYATGGASDDLLAFTTHGGTLALQRRYALRWQAFPRRQYPYQYAGNWQQARLFYPVQRGDRACRQARLCHWPAGQQPGAGGLGLWRD
ncbi:Quinoprotein amine dehydrogenase, beta chain, partial [mine drainage metagenome]